MNLDDNYIIEIAKNSFKRIDRRSSQRKNGWLDRQIRTVGKKNFVNHFYSFQNRTKEGCAQELRSEGFKESSVSFIVSAAKNIFKTHKEAEALERIVNSSSRVPDDIRNRAKSILETL